MNASENIELIKSFVKVMNILDQPRNLNWKLTLSDVADLIQRHCTEIDLNLSS
jgi:hypothetical protein